MIESTYSTSSLQGFVSSKRRLHVPPKSCGDAEVQADRLGVADVQIAVGLGREPGIDPPAMFARAVVLADDLADEVGGGGRGGGRAIGAHLSVSVLCSIGIRLRPPARPHARSRAFPPQAVFGPAFTPGLPRRPRLFCHARSGASLRQRPGGP